MRTTIEVADSEEAKLIRQGLADPTVRALVKVMGALSRLSSDTARQRALTYAYDLLNEQEAERDAG